jgi:tetratricopeptide (TPR) repeat protein
MSPAAPTIQPPAGAPFFAIALLLVPLNLWFRTHGHTVEMREVGFVERLLGAATAIWFYLGKALVPVNLSFVYPLWNVDSGELRWWLPLAAAIGITLALWFARGNPVGRSLLVAWLYFCIALLPVLGFVQVGYMVFSPVADYYAHLALMGVAALLGAAWYFAYERAALPAGAAAIVVVGTLLLLTRQQAALYQSAESIWHDTARRNPTSYVAQDQLGVLLFKAGRTDESLEHFRTALALRPDRWESWFNVGNVLHRSGRWDQSIEYLERAVQLNADCAEAHGFLALAYAQQGRRADAIAAAENALRAARATGQGQLEQGISEWLAKYRTQP